MTETTQSRLGRTPREIVAELDRYIIGQVAAKKMVAIALRNRARRMTLEPELREEVTPKNIIMIGPTGVGKTEIARRLSKLDNAPFIKVEATKYTEVGYVGRDVESMIRELTDIGLNNARQVKVAEMEEAVEAKVRERLLDELQKIRHRPAAAAPPPPPPPTGAASAHRPVFVSGPEGMYRSDEASSGGGADWIEGREALGRRLDAGELEDVEIEVQIKQFRGMMLGMPMQPGMEEMGIDLQKMMDQIAPPRQKNTKMKIADAREILREEMIDGMIDQESIRREAIAQVEQSGIVFIDEIDKVAGRSAGQGPDVSREGVQRDILPIVEGSTVFTKHGPVRTDHILFIAAGAFHMSKPSDLIPELQGRFPLRVELTDLTADDFVRILTEPTNSLTKQYSALMATEGLDVTFTEDGIREIAASAYRINRQTENIGARRLYTLMERVMEEIAFEASDMRGVQVKIDRPFVQARLQEVMEDEDLSKFIL